ncbi:MAG: c-type cytochrome [Gammaproteobacteria bacterium]|nr:c-type cytochrome [Gammaproteobacteria bacterium]
MATALLGAVLSYRAEARPLLRICVDTANPTMRMDARIAREAAAIEGYAVRFSHFVGYGRGGDGFPIGRFAKMARSECELIMGFPVDASDAHLPPDVQATTAYASTGFVLVRRAAARARRLSQMPRGSEVGIAQLDTYAGLLFSQHPNITMHVYPSDADMVADLEARHLAAGLAWQPSIEAYLHRHPGAASLREDLLPGPHMRWNLVALYAPRSSAAAQAFASGVEALRRRGALSRLILPYESAEPEAPAGPPALYTEAQATQGALAYAQNCAMCHGPLLDGQEGGYSGPALKGADFADPSYDFHVSDIFNFVAKLMPAATPGSLNPEQDVEIMAFLLKENGYPAGNQALTYGEASASKVPILYYGK